MWSGAVVNGLTGFENGACVNFHLNFPAGLGLSFNLQPSLTIIGKYFQVRRPIANGLAMAGSPVFLCTLAPLNQFLFERFGWRGSFCILGAMLLNCCVAGSLMRPLNDGRGAGYLLVSCFVCFQSSKCGSLHNSRCTLELIERYTGQMQDYATNCGCSMRLGIDDYKKTCQFYW